jgi:hypothetical protein
MRFADVLAWRWTPTFALVGGALVFALLAAAVVPDQFGAEFDVRTPKASASAPRTAFGRSVTTASASPLAPTAAPAAPVEPPAVATQGPARERKPRERRPYVPHGREVYENHVVDRIFNRGGATPPGEGNIPVEPPPGAPAVEPPGASEPPSSEVPAPR